jgi:hypothetical protein
MKSKNIITKRNPFGGMKGVRKWGSGNHGDKKKQISRDKCRTKNTETDC